jgi:RNA polymerase sigma-70 factor (ECF subfamily)
MEAMNEQALLDAARTGDPKALDKLLAASQARIYRFGMKMCRNPEDASDVLQETMIAIARTIRDFRGASSASTWMYTIARSFCIKKRRRSKFAPTHMQSLSGDDAHEVVQVADPSRGPEEEVVGRHIDAALELAIRGLEPMYREVLILRDVEGLTAPEVAEVTGLRVEAVKSRLHRARLTVRSKLAPMLGISDETGPTTGATCPDVLMMFSRHTEGEISPDMCKDMELHLSTCPKCRGACNSLRRTIAMCSAGPEPQVPAHVQDLVRGAVRQLISLPR